MMSNKIVPLLLVLATASTASFAANTKKNESNCERFARIVLQNPSSQDLTANFTEIVHNLSCFIEASEADPKSEDVIRPALNNLWNAVTSFGGAQQQGSNTTAGATTNAVTKPSGPTALIEEFGGVNATSGTSSMTYQFSPGTLLKNIALTGVAGFCLDDDPHPGCISAREAAGWAPLTFKVTANTSSGGQSMSGTATNSSSSSSSQQVTVNSKGASGPSFTGLTAQYSFLNSKSKASVKTAPNSNSTGSKKKSSSGSKTTNPSATVPGDAGSGTKQPKPVSPAAASVATYYSGVLQKLIDTQEKLESCTVYVTWIGKVKTDPTFLGYLKRDATTNPSQTDVDALAGFIMQKYQDLQSSLRSSPDQHCSKDVAQALSELYTTVLEARAYEAFSVEQKPELSIEYDLNTPQNKPDYSSVKLTFSKSLGRPTDMTPKKTSSTANKASTSLNSSQTAIDGWAKTQAAELSKAPASGAKNDAGAANNQGSTAGADPSPWTITANGTVDIYNGAPPSGVPSASHLRDIQAGAEIAYVWSPTQGALRTIFGSIITAAAYSYQDQTSPAILTGPALSDFTGLPSSTTSAYAQRGIIHLGQVRFGIGDLANKNVSFPLAFTYSNRTELIVKPVWGLQFGVSYNFNSLLGGSSSKQTAAGGAPSQ